MVHNASHGDRNSHSNSHHTPPLTDRLTRSLSFQPRCAKFIQVAAHSAPDDCWVSFHGDIYDITKLISENEGPLVQPLLKHAGSDISHWFDEVDGDVDETKENSETKVINLITHVDAVTNLRRPYTPYGRFVHVPPNEPSTQWDTSPETPWWQDRTQIVGRVSRNLRKIRIKNVLTRQEHLMEVPGEETLMEIQTRYAEFNWHAESYAWRVLKRSGGPESELKFTDVDLEKTLEQNGVVDDTQTFEELSIPNDAAIPVIHLYFKDDLTVA